MLLYPLPNFLTCFSRTFIITGNSNYGRIPSSCSFPAFVTSFSYVPFINEQDTGCINVEAIVAVNKGSKGVIITPRNLPPSFFYFMFYSFSYTQWLFNFNIIQIFIFKVNPCPAVITAFLLFFSNLSSQAKLLQLLIQTKHLQPKGQKSSILRFCLNYLTFYQEIFLTELL